MSLELLSSLRRNLSQNLRQHAKEEEMKVRNMEDTGVHICGLVVPKRYDTGFLVGFLLLEAKDPNYSATEEITLELVHCKKVQYAQS